MAVFQAFRALRPIPEKASSVAALPYDVVTREEAKMIGDKNPDSFLHVDRPEMDLPDRPICMMQRSMTRQEKIFRIWKETVSLSRMRHRATIFMN